MRRHTTVNKLLATALVAAWVVDVLATMAGRDTGLYRYALTAYYANLAAMGLTVALWVGVMTTE